MTGSLTIVTVVGFIAAATVLVTTLRAGRREPVRRVPWVIALVLIGISLVFRLVIVFGITMAASYADAVPIAIGELAVAAVFAVAYLRPAWGGWLLIGTALGIPALSALLDLLAGEIGESATAAMLGSYSVPAIVSAALLLWAGTHAPASAVVAKRPEDR